MAALVLAGLSGCAGRAAVLLPAPAPSPAAQVACARLHTALPAAVDGKKRRTTKPESDRTAAWGDPPITLLCGVPRPAGLGGGQIAPIGVNGVAWLPQTGTRGTTFTAVDRGVFVEVDVPARYAGQSGVLLDLSDALARALPQRPIPR